MCYYVQRVSDHTEHRLAPISEASVLLQDTGASFCTLLQADSHN